MEYKTPSYTRAANKAYRDRLKNADIELYRQRNNEYNNKYRQKLRENGVVITHPIIICECGCEVNKYYLKEHLKRKIHINNLEKINSKIDNITESINNIDL